MLLVHPDLLDEIEGVGFRGLGCRGLGGLGFRASGLGLRNYNEGKELRTTMVSGVFSKYGLDPKP